MTLRTHRLLLVSILLAVAGSWIVLVVQAELLAARLNSYAAQGWAVDAPVYYPVGYHLLLVIPLTISIIFAKRFYVALVFAVIYLGLHLGLNYVAFQKCFIGKDICPLLPPWTQAESINLFNLSVTVVVPVIFIWVLCLARKRLDPGMP